MVRVNGDGTTVTSASDLSAASSCEFAFLRQLDHKLGRTPGPPQSPDAMLDATARLGDAHELTVLAYYKTQYADVAEITRPERDAPDYDEAVADAVATTQAAFDRRADVVYQATFRTENFIGFADFIVKQPDGRYQIQDTKLAQHAKVTALLQLAAYAEQLRLSGLDPHSDVVLVLGGWTTGNQDGPKSRSVHRLRDIEPVYRLRKAHLDRLITDRLADQSPVAWNAPGIMQCGVCEPCLTEIERTRDLWLVAGLRADQRDKLRATGITTIEELATATDAALTATGVGTATRERLRAQAAIQPRTAHPEHPVFEWVDR